MASQSSTAVILFAVAILAQFAYITQGLPFITPEYTAEGPCVKVKGLTMEELDLSWVRKLVNMDKRCNRINMANGAASVAYFVLMPYRWQQIRDGKF